MSNTPFIKAEEIAAALGVSPTYAYKIIQKMNKELKAQGYMTIAGRVSRQYFQEKFYGLQLTFEGD
jgi:Mn-dependent DtxR family transcriptional regulator